MYFIDANTFLEIELADARKEECESLLEKVAQNKSIALTSDFILCSILIELIKKSTIKKARDFITFLETVKSIEIYQPALKTLFIALNKMEKYDLDFDDALVVACMLENKIKTLVSFDKHFDKVKEIKRVEPGRIL